MRILSAFQLFFIVPFLSDYFHSAMKPERNQLSCRTPSVLLNSRFQKARSISIPGKIGKSANARLTNSVVMLSEAKHLGSLALWCMAKNLAKKRIAEGGRNGS